MPRQAIRAGNLIHRVAFLQPLAATANQDTYGAPQGTPTPAFNAWGSLESIAGREFFFAAVLQVHADATHRFRCRWQPAFAQIGAVGFGVTSAWQLSLTRGGVQEIYEILEPPSVIDERRAEVQFLVKRKWPG